MPATADLHPSRVLPTEVQASSSEGRVRLHITPFTPELLAKIIPRSIQDNTSSVSFHSVETFPERGFGYIEVSSMAAEQLKKKLNGATLMGQKVRVQDAKPERKRQLAVEGEDDEREAGSEGTDKHKKKKKRKLTERVHEGFEIPEGRKIKRGWTETQAEMTQERIKEKREKKIAKGDEKRKKRREGSKYTTEPELLFKTKLEPVAAATLAMQDSPKAAKAERKEGKLKKKSKRDGHVVIHEFEHSTKHARFLKESDRAEQSKPVAEYVDGKGWVDEAGTVVEPEVKRKKSGKEKQKRATQGIESGQKHAVLPHVPDATQHIRVDEDPDVGPSAETIGAPTKKGKKLSKRSHPDTNGESSLKVKEGASKPVSPDMNHDPDSSNSDLETSVNETQSPTERVVHPLEALYKRPKPLNTSALNSPSRLAPIDTSRTAFSFFDAEPDEDDKVLTAEDGDTVEPEPMRPQEPATPFTERDLHWRGMRSAAPPPDTPGGRSKRVFTFEGTLEEEDEDEGSGQLDVTTQDELDPDGTIKSVDGHNGNDKPKEQSEIAKWFYENRGENNRAWRRRRREVLKTKRQTENRKYARKLA